MSNVCVYLVGAGPGDVELLTLRGARLLEQADIVVYDYLANAALVDHVKPSAELLYVGKKGFSAHVTQDEINALLVQKARELDACGGGVLVRLKGGDPFVFGRGGEEALALSAAGIPFEVVPGVTSGIAAPAYAGIPVTHRGIASSVTFITGHEDPTKNASAIDWTALARLAQKGGTLCFYMGMRNLELIAGRLAEQGVSADTPVALVRWGTTSNQQTLVACIEDVAIRAREAGFGAPAIILVGPVASLREKLSWFEERPLFGRRIVVTRSRSQASTFSARLRELGADVVELPTIAFAEPDDYSPLDQAIRRMASYDWVVFTSVNGVDAFFSRLALLAADATSCPIRHADARALAGACVAAIGPATAKRLQDHGIRADVLPGEYRGEAVFDAIADASARFGISLQEARVLVPRAQVAREVLPDLLRDAGAQVDVVAAYQTVLPEGDAAAELAEAIATGDIDAVTFTSSSTARNLLALLGDRAEALHGVDVFSIGPITSKTLADAGFAPTCEAEEYTIPGLVDALVKTYQRVDSPLAHRGDRSQG